MVNKYSALLENLSNNKKEPTKKVGSISVNNSKEYIKRNPSKIAILEGNKVILKFPYSIENLGEVKAINGRKYDPKTKTWNVKISLLVLKEIDRLGYTFSRELEKRYYTLLNKVGKFDIDKVNFDVKNIKTPKGLSLRDYQIETLKFIEGRKGKAILALSPGTGKTPTVATYIYNHKELKPIVIVTPAVLKFNWRNELNRWSPNRKIEILEGKKSKKLKSSSDIIIINYDILSDWVKRLKEIKPKLVVFDEVQMIKAIKGVKRVKAAKSLSKSTNQILCLSGTPVISKVADLWNIINMTEPNLFGSFYEFGNRYCGPIQTQWGTQYNGSSNEEELNMMLSNCMIRYKKEDVLKELPEKQFSFVPLELKNRNEYNKAENNFIEYVREHKGNRAAKRVKYAETLAKMTELRQLAVLGCIDNSIEWVKNFIEKSNEKLVIFGIHKAILSRLENEFKDISIKIDGSTPSGEYRQNLIDKFQNDSNIRIAILQQKSAGTGITLTAASSCVFLEMPFTPADIEQCYGRIDRIGQKNNMNIYFLLPENTIEDKLSLIICKKYDIINKVVEGEFNETDEQDTVSKLIDELNRNEDKRK